MRNHRGIFVFVLLGIIGLFIFLHFFQYVAREAALDFKVTRTQSLKIAEDYLKSCGYDLKGYRSAVVFDSDSDQAEFVEKTLGLAKANQLYKKDVRIWYWHCRWFKELQKEEFTCDIAPDGTVIGYNHDIKEEETRPTISQDSARVLAEQAFSKFPGLSLTEYHLNESHNDKRPNRMDYNFTYEKNNFKIGEGTLRVWVGVQGDKLDGYGQFVHIPETFTLQQEKISAYRSLLEEIDSSLSELLFIAVAILLLLGFRVKKLRWKLFFPLALLLFLCDYASTLNNLPLTFIEYSTTDSWSSHIWSSIGMGLISAVVEGLMIWILAVAAWYTYLYLKKQDTLSIPASFKDRIAPKGLLTATAVGYSTAFIQLGYVALFYLIGYKYLGVFSPAESKYDNNLSTYIPWIFPLTIGLSAALTEEFMFRLFAISLFRRWIKYNWIAIAIPAFIWGFGHTFYPVEPIYIRGVEVGLVGLFLGWIFLRYGILATVIAHYTYDCVLVGLPLLRSSNIYFISSGVGVVLLMFLPAILLGPVAKYRKWELIEETPSPKPESTIPVEPVPLTTIPTEEIAQNVSAESLAEYKPLSNRLCLLLLILSLLSAGIIGWNHFKKYDSTPVYKIGKKEATQLATGFVDQMGVSHKGFTDVTYTSVEREHWADIYLSRILSEDSIKQFYQTLGFNRNGWYTKWFQPTNPEYYWVGYDDLGHFIGYGYHYKEEAAGASLSKDSAQILAEAFLQKIRVNPDDYTLIEQSNEKKPHRLDYSFTYEKKGIKVKELTFRMHVYLAGDKIDGYNRYFKLPENFERDLEKTTIRQTVIEIILVIVGLVVVVLVLISFFKMFRAGEFQWKPGIYFAGISLLLTIVTRINSIPSYYLSYSGNTQEPVATFLFKIIWQNALGLPISFFAIWVFVVFAMSFYRRIFPGTITLKQRFRFLHPRNWGHPAYFQAFGLAVALELIVDGVRWFPHWVETTYFQSDMMGYTYSSFVELSNICPFLTNLTGFISTLLLDPLFLLLIFGLAFYWFKNPRWVLVIILILVALMEWDSNHNWKFCLFNESYISFCCILLFWFFYRVVGRKWLVYVLSMWSESLTQGLRYLHMAKWEFRLEAYFWIVLFFIPIFVIVIQYFKNKNINQPLPVSSTTPDNIPPNL